MQFEQLTLNNDWFIALILSSSQEMLEAFEAVQGKFRQIRSLTRRQKDHLKRFHGGSEASNGNICPSFPPHPDSKQIGF